MTRCIFLYSQIAFGHDSKTVSVRCFAFSFWVARLKLLILDYRYLFQYYLHCYLYFWRRVQDSNLYNLLVERISNPMQYQIMLNSPWSGLWESNPIQTVLQTVLMPYEQSTYNTFLILSVKSELSRLSPIVPYSYGRIYLSENSSGLLADGVGFEPTGLSPHQISSLRSYNHLSNHPYVVFPTQAYHKPNNYVQQETDFLKFSAQMV